MKYIKRLEQLKSSLPIPVLVNKISTLQMIDQMLKKRQVPKKPIINIQLSPREIEQYQDLIEPRKYDELQIINHVLSNFRQFVSLEYGIWSIANLKTAQLLKEEYNLTTGLEIMSGNGMWSRAFTQVGIKMFTTDDLSWEKTSNTGAKQFVKIEDLAAIDALKKYGQQIDFIFWAWAPNFGEEDYKFLQEYRNLEEKPLLLMVGEYLGATNSRIFWQNATKQKIKNIQINDSFSSFDFIDEKIWLIK